MVKSNKHQFEKLSRDEKENTVIMAGQTKFTIDQLEEEIKVDSEIGKKLKSIEHELEKY
jgi:putative AlgH/UPF0301 family transcriptional regulator